MSRERAVLGSLITVLVFLWAGFLVHRAPRFPGSLAGGVLAVTGTSLMVVISLAYMAIKRIRPVRTRFSSRFTMGKLLEWHVYTSAAGAILVLLHTGHRFESDLGMALTTAMLAAVLSGYVGRHLLGRVGLDVREKRKALSRLETAYNEAARDFARNPGAAAPVVHPAQLAESIAELEYSIRAHGRYEKWMAIWLNVHIAASLVFYVLLAMHVWASIHFGLRWFN